MMLSQLLLLARWDAARRGARWGARSWGGTGGALVLCLVFGALDAAGQITWLNSPSDSPSATLKVASVGFVVLAGVYGLGCLFFNFREGLFYQRPSVRWVFFLSALVVAVRCVCWMLVGLDIVRFKEPKRLIFLFCLTTTFEIVAAAIWGFTRATKHLRLEGKGAATKLESLRSEPVAPAAPQPAENSILTHTVNARPSTMHSSRYLALLALLTLAVLSAASSYSEDDDASDDSATTPEEAPSTTPEIQGQARNALDDALLAGILKGLAGNPAIAHAATPMPCTQVEGVDRKHGHKKHCKGGHADECEDQDKEKAKCKGDKNKDNLHGQEDRYKTISLPAQGQPYFY
ncbi:hypothetical protein IWQ56_003963, partial [Coemansia nantahalensis]